MRKDWVPLILTAVAGLAVVALCAAVVVEARDIRSQYNTACTAGGGVPVYNGKHWECLKEIK